MAHKKAVVTDLAALPLGPYSQAIDANGMVFVAGEKGIDPSTGRLVPGGIAAQTRQALKNIQVILEAAGLTLDHAVRSVVYITDMDRFDEMNAVYAEHFGEAPPARSCVEVRRLPAGAEVEIEITAVR